MSFNRNQQAFLELLRAGLWESDARLMPYGGIDYNDICHIAEEQSVEGIVAAGLEHVMDVKAPKEIALSFAGAALQLESRNVAMNGFIEQLTSAMRDAGIYALLMKGQGVAQCYERPNWRSAGDIDFLLCEDNYEKAKQLLIPEASSVEPEGAYGKHLGMIIDSWSVELHGSLRSGLSRSVDQTLDSIQEDYFSSGDVRGWMNGRTQVFLPGANGDALYVFTHILQHFYKGGIGLRQICDWCRLLYAYRDSLNHGLLESRIRKMGLMTEWRAFGAFAVEFLGMSTEAMPFYSSSWKWKRKADRICTFVLDVGNFGHNRDMSYIRKYPYFIRKCRSFGRRCSDLWRHARVFPMDTLRFFPVIVFNGLRAAARGE